MKNVSRGRISGFTLIELLVVVLIIGILAGVALPQYTKAVKKSRAQKARVWAARVRDAASEYFMANGRYTGCLEDLTVGYEGTFPNVSCLKYPNGMQTSAEVGKGADRIRLFVWDYEGYIFRVAAYVGDGSYGNKDGGFGSMLHARDPAKNYSMMCAEHACHGTPPGSFCKDVMGIQSEPVVNGDYCFRLYAEE